MPNHFHAIITIDDSMALVGAIHESPLPNTVYESPFWKKIQRRRMLLPMVIGYLKMNSAKQIKLMCNSSGTPIWQRNYYEHIIQTEKEYVLIENYINNNPANWADDQLWMNSQ
jgi:putative transposase